MPGSSAFVGREWELASVLRALAQPPAVVLIEGEAGIGKSRLLAEVLAALAASSSGRALVAACPPFREPHTLGPVVDAVRQGTERVAGLRLSPLAGTLRVLFPEWSAELPLAPEPAEDATAARHRLFRALSELLAAMRVATLVVEDAHWADDATVQFLLFLVARRPPRVSVVISYRPEDLAEDSLLRTLSARLSPGFAHARVTLEPLGLRDTVALVSSMLQGEPLSDAFAAFLHEGTDGVPLAVEESVRFMIDRADLVLRSDGWVRRHMEAIAIPPTVRDGVLERVRRLAPDAQTMLRAVAVLAEPTDAATVLAVSGLPPVPALPGLGQALDSRLIIEDVRGQVGFHHMLAGRAVLDAMPARERRAMHLRAGRALEAETPPPLAQLARHFREAGEYSEWCRYAEQAADQALAAGDERLAAATLYDLMVRVGQAPGALLRLISKSPTMTPLEGDQLQKLANTLKSAVDGEGTTPREAAQLQVQLGRVLIVIQHYEAGREELEKAVSRPELDDVDRARTMILLGQPTEFDRPAWAHRRWLRRADKVLDAVDPLHRRTLGLDRAMGLLLLGEEEGWAAAAALDEESAGLTPSQRGLRDVDVGDVATMWGRFDEARQRLKQALVVADEHQYLRLRGMVLVNLLRLDWLCGAWSGLGERASELSESEDLTASARAEARLVLGLLRSVTDSDIDPHRELSSVLAASQGSDPRLVTEPAGALARLLLADGDVGGALAVTEDAIGVVSGKGVWIWATDLAPARVAALLAADRVSDAEALTAVFARGLRGRDAPAPQASLLLCRALLAQSRNTPARAAMMFEAAATAWIALPRPYEALLARERRAGCLLAAGQRDQGLSELSGVFQGMAALGAQRDADRASRVLQCHGARARPSRPVGRPGYGDRLSPREWQVVALVAQGRTNRLVAEELVVSVQTVNSHVKSAMRKLGASSRKELGALAAEARNQGNAAG